MLVNPLFPLLTTALHSVNSSDLPPIVKAPDAACVIGFNISKYGLKLSYPLTIKLQDFQKTVQDCFNIEAKEKFSLKESINNILHSNNQIKYEASKLTNALKSNNMILGHWGEMILENILIFLTLITILAKMFYYDLNMKLLS